MNKKTNYAKRRMTYNKLGLNRQVITTGKIYIYDFDFAELFWC
jgi:hypothetical protein